MVKKANRVVKYDENDICCFWEYYGNFLNCGHLTDDNFPELLRKVCCQADEQHLQNVIAVYEDFKKRGKLKSA